MESRLYTFPAPAKRPQIRPRENFASRPGHFRTFGSQNKPLSLSAMDIDCYPRTRMRGSCISKSKRPRYFRRTRSGLNSREMIPGSHLGAEEPRPQRPRLVLAPQPATVCHPCARIAPAMPNEPNKPFVSPIRTRIAVPCEPSHDACEPTRRRKSPDPVPFPSARRAERTEQPLCFSHSLPNRCLLRPPPNLGEPNLPANQPAAGPMDLLLISSVGIPSRRITVYNLLL